MKKLDRKGLRTWIEIDTAALEHNYKIFRGLISKKTKLCGVVKSNAYGHGLVDYSKMLVKLGVDWIAVDSIVEGIRLRKEGIKTPIFVLGYTLPENFEEALKHKISVSVSNMEALQAVTQIKGLAIHLKIDSGMHRQGFLAQEREKVIEIAKEHDLNIEGIFTHFAAAKNHTTPDDTLDQIVVFEAWTKAFDKNGFEFITHAAATGGAMLYPEAHYDMVRIGIGLYGHWPSLEAKLAKEDKIKLKQALTWKSLVAEVKSLPVGSRIGYDFTAELHRDSKIAIVPIGYWHGFPRALSSVGSVMVNGMQANVLGRVSMDMLIVDVTNIHDAKVGDEVIILGPQSPLIDAEYVSMLAETSPYELITRINPLIKKFYI